MSAVQVIQVTCPRCGRQFRARIYSIVDVGRAPNLKVLLLQGRLNLAFCPYCGNAGFINAPLLYHDPSKELLLCYMPSEVELSDVQRQKLIGSLTNAVLSTLPAEKRKAYLLQPRIFLTLPSLLEAILEADGITKEMLEAQTARIQLLNDLIRALKDETALNNLLEERKELLDFDFIEILSASLEAATVEGEEQLAQALVDLRQRVMEKIAPDEAGRLAFLQRGLMQRFLSLTDEAQMEALVARERPLLDYRFFQMLTDEIEAARAQGREDEVRRLSELRGKLAAIIARQDQESRAALLQAADLLQRVLESDDPEQTIKEHLDEINEVFFLILSINIEEAKVRGEKDIAEALEGLGRMVMSILQERMPPQLRLINQLLEAEYPEETKRILEENASQITRELVDMMAIIVQDLQAQGRSQIARRLAGIQEQAMALLGQEEDKGKVSVSR